MEVDNSHLRLALVASALIVSLSIGYYLVVFLPAERRVADDQRREEQVFKKQLECQEQYDNMRKYSHNVVGVHYSTVSNKCIVSFTDDDGVTQESPTDKVVQTNKSK